MIYITDEHRHQDGPLNFGLYLNNTSGVTVSGCSFIGNTFPRNTLDWITQHPSLRKRQRVVGFRRARHYY